MNLQSTIYLYAGGPGSGCNPDVGKCGRTGTILYHGTTKGTLSKIMKDGLSPNHKRIYDFSRKGKVYLTNSLRRAKWYAGSSAMARNSSNTAVVKFELPKSVVDKLELDPMDLGRRDSKWNSRSFTYEGKIPAKHISSIYTPHPSGDGNYVETKLK